MENSNYNSLTDKLIQNGIINSQTENENNFFKNMNSEIVPNQYANFENDFETQKSENLPKTNNSKTKKRINEYDLNLIKNIQTKNQSNTQTPFETIKRFIDFKKTKLNNKNASFLELFLYKFFPKIYKAKLIKKAVNKMLELNLDAKVLLDKTIPYGEREERYQDLIKYLNCANELQTKLKQNFN